MPTLPWMSFAEPDPAHEYTVLATLLPLKRRRDLPAFLRASMAVRKQLAHSDGLLGYSMDAHLRQRRFWTLSVWRDAAALGAFSHADPHEQEVAHIRPMTGPTNLVSWTLRGAQLPVTWAQARERLAAAAK